MTTHSMLRSPASVATGSASWANATPPIHSVMNAAPAVPPRTYLIARFLRIPSPWFVLADRTRPPGRSESQFRGPAFHRWIDRVAALLRSRARAAGRRREPAGRRAVECGTQPGDRPLVELASESIGEREPIDEASVDARRTCAVDDDAGRRHCRGDRGERSRAVASGRHAHRVPRQDGVVHIDLDVGGGFQAQPLRQRGLHHRRQLTCTGPHRCTHEERVDGRAVGPRGDGRCGDVAAGCGQCPCKAGEQAVGVAAATSTIQWSSVPSGLTATRIGGRGGDAARSVVPGGPARRVRGTTRSCPAQHGAGLDDASSWQAVSAARRRTSASAAASSPSRSGWTSASATSSTTWSRRSRRSWSEAARLREQGRPVRAARGADLAGELHQLGAVVPLHVGGGASQQPRRRQGVLDVSGFVDGELDEQRARRGRRGVEAEHVEDAGGPSRTRSPRSCGSSSVVLQQQLVDAGDDGEAQHAQRVELARVGPPAVHRGGHRRYAAFEHAGHVEQPNSARAAAAQDVEQQVGVLVRPARSRRRAGSRTTTAARRTGRPR